MNRTSTVLALATILAGVPLAAQQAAPSPPRFFDTSLSRIPSHFQGADLEQLYRALERPKRGAYETSPSWYARIEAQRGRVADRYYAAWYAPCGGHPIWAYDPDSEVVRLHITVWDLEVPGVLDPARVPVVCGSRGRQPHGVVLSDELSGQLRDKYQECEYRDPPCAREPQELISPTFELSRDSARAVRRFLRYLMVIHIPDRAAEDELVDTGSKLFPRFPRLHFVFADEAELWVIDGRNGSVLRKLCSFGCSDTP